MNGLNVVVLSGNIATDLEITHTKNDKKKCTFTLAVNRKYHGQQQTEFVPITTFGGTASAIVDNLQKGSPIELIGSINVYNYENDQGNQKQWISVIGRNINFLPQRDGGGETPEPNQEPEPTSDDEEDIPF